VGDIVFVQNLLVIFLLLLVLLTAIDPAMAVSRKKRSKADLEVQRELEPISQDLGALTQKGMARGLFSPEEVAKALDIKLKLLDLFQQYPTNDMLVKPAYQAGRLFRAREQYDDAFDFYNFIQTNFPSSPYAAQARVEIQRMKQQLGDNYFSGNVSMPEEPALVKP
jgi:hypothetical protein